MFNPLTTIVSLAVAKRKGVEPSESIKIALMSGLFPPVTGIILAVAMAQRAAPVVPATGLSGTIEVPDVLGVNAKEATQKILNAGFTNVVFNPDILSSYEVEVQDPEGQTMSTKDDTITLTMSQKVTPPS